MGILHRDISDGNVMLLRPGRSFTPKEQQEPLEGESEPKNEMLAESERRLQEVLASLKRNPVGMLSDFDLHTVHSFSRGGDPTDSAVKNDPSPAQPTTADPPTTTHEGNVPHAKRRKTSSTSSMPISSTLHSNTTRRSDVPRGRRRRNAGKGQHIVIDFRTVSGCHCVILRA